MTSFIEKYIYDPWLISIATLLLTLIVQPIMNMAYKNIRSRYGAFSGTYLALTTFNNADQILVEIISVKHIAETIKGEIKSFCVAHIKNGEIIDVDKFSGSYLFDGFVDGRVIVGSYKTKESRQNSSGSVVLKADSSGVVFSGTSIGYEDMFVQTNDCYWLHDQVDFIKEEKSIIISRLNSIISSLTLYTSREKLLITLNEQWNIGHCYLSDTMGISDHKLSLLRRGSLKTSLAGINFKSCCLAHTTKADLKTISSLYFPFSGVPQYEEYILKMLLDKYHSNIDKEIEQKKLSNNSYMASTVNPRQ